MAEYTSVPELSLKNYLMGTTNEKETFIRELFKGIKYYGFIILKDHLIDNKLLESCYKDSKKLFDLTENTKKQYISSAGAGQRGYTPFGQEHAKDHSAPDLKEFWHVGRELSLGHKYKDFYPENIWPSEIPSFKENFLKLYKALDNVGEVILEALTFSLDVPKDYFSKMVQDGNSILRLLHYPPIAANVDPNCVRAAAHEDINLITILVSASASGLELLDRNGKWLPIETQANNLIVDAGDMLSRITNEVIPSTTHRVVNPQDGANISRYSMPYFIHPNPDTVLSCIESCKGKKALYPDISSQDFLIQRLKEIGLMK